MSQAAFQYVPVEQAYNIANKQRLIDIMQSLTTTPLHELADAAQSGYYADARICMSHPINEVQGTDGVCDKFWKLLRYALPDAERRDAIVAGGRYRDADWIGCWGHYLGTFEHDWLGIPATGGALTVRYAEGHELRDGKIATSYIFIDFLDLMQQAGYFPIAPSLGSIMSWLPPLTHDGVLLTPQDHARSERTILRVLAMHSALGHYNGQPPTREVLDLMHMRTHWHPQFMWYGPAGIGTTRGLHGFEDYHQIPFLIAFPDRRGDADVGHFIRIGDGDYAVTGGWGYLQATHTGGDFLGMPPTGRRIKMRVMDFYRCDDVTIRENWIPMDIPHMLLQMGVDVFGRMRHQARQAGASRTSEWLLRG